MSSSLYERVQNACEELADWMKDNPGIEPYDVIFEIADGACPVYYSEILQYAAEDTFLATSVPDIEPAFDGEATPVNLIASNIFEYVEGELWKYYREHEDDYKEVEERQSLYEDIMSFIDDDTPEDFVVRWEELYDPEEKIIYEGHKEEAEQLLDDLEVWDFLRKNEY